MPDTICSYKSAHCIRVSSVSTSIRKEKREIMEDYNKSIALFTNCPVQSSPVLLIKIKKIIQFVRPKSDARYSVSYSLSRQWYEFYLKMIKWLNDNNEKSWGILNWLYKYILTVHIMCEWMQQQIEVIALIGF